MFNFLKKVCCEKSELPFSQSRGWPATQRMLLTPSVQKMTMLGSCMERPLMKSEHQFSIVSTGVCLRQYWSGVKPQLAWSRACVSKEPTRIHCEIFVAIKRTIAERESVYFQHQYTDYQHEHSLHMTCIYTREHTPPHGHEPVGHMSLQCVSVDRLHAATGTRSMSAPCIVQVAEVDFGKIEVHFIFGKLLFNFSKRWPCPFAHSTKSASNHLHMPLHFRAAIACSSLQYWRCDDSIPSTYSIDDVPRNMSFICIHL